MYALMDSDTLPETIILYVTSRITRHFSQGDGITIRPLQLVAEIS